MTMHNVHPRVLMLLIFLSFSGIQTFSQSTIALSREIGNLIKTKQYDRINRYMDTASAGMLTPDILRRAQQQAETELGPLLSVGEVMNDSLGSKINSATLLTYSNGVKLLYILYDAHYRALSIRLDDFIASPFYRKVDYFQKAFTEKNIVLNTRAGIALPGTIAFPKDKTGVPMVVFVHGSGPSDRDETVGPNKPFKDLATGLAQLGIASLRYEKRSFTYQTDNSKISSDSVTYYDETIEDALAALKLARQTPGVDSTRIYLVGHSLGAYLGPRIASLYPNLKGLVMMAPPARPVLDVIPEQIEYLDMADSVMSPVENFQLNAIKWQIANAKSDSLSMKTKRAILPFGIGARYWLYDRSYKALPTAGALTLPILIQQGERDYQVSMKDYGMWQQALQGKTNVSLKSYDKLNHLFLEGTGKSLPSEYEHPSHIPDYVIKDLADWISTH